MSVSRDELEDLLNEADKFVNNGGMAVVSQQEEDEINALIGECERVSISNTKNLGKTKAVAKSMSVSQNDMHVELADLHVKELEVLTSQQKLSEISVYLKQVEMTNMSLQHEISEIKNTTEWEYFQHIAADQFAQGCHLREIARIENAADREIKLLLVNERNPHLSIGAKQPLFRAVLAGDAELVRQLIADGANVNMPDANGHYPICDLMAFNIPNCSEILQALIGAGVNLNQENCFGWTAMSYREAHLVGVRRDPRTLELLKQHNAKRGADPRSVITGWESASIAAVAHKSQEALKDSKALRLNAELLAQELAFEILYERITQYQAAKSRVIVTSSHKPREPNRALYNSTVQYKSRMPSVNSQTNSRSVTKLHTHSAVEVDNRNIFSAIFDGMKKFPQYLGEEACRLHLGHETNAAISVNNIFHVANIFGTYIGADLHKWKSGQDSYLRYTLTERGVAQTISAAAEFTQDNARIAMDKLEKATANDYAEFLGELITGQLFGYGAARILGVAEQMARREITFLRDAHKSRQSLKKASNKIPEIASNPNVERLTNVMEQYLGKDFKMVINPKGDPVFINQANTKKIRFDVKNPHGYKPHGHAQYFNGETWVDFTDVHRIELKDVSTLIKNSKPKLKD